MLDPTIKPGISSSNERQSNNYPIIIILLEHLFKLRTRLKQQSNLFREMGLVKIIFEVVKIIG